MYVFLCFYVTALPSYETCNLQYYYHSGTPVRNDAQLQQPTVFTRPLKNRWLSLVNLGPGFTRILRQSYDNVRNIERCTLILRQIYDNANFQDIL